MENDESCQVIMWRCDNFGAQIRVWTYSDRNVFLASGTLDLSAEFLEELLSEVRASASAAADATLF